jgi:excisionase family DNA binding protein
MNAEGAHAPAPTPQAIEFQLEPLLTYRQAADLLSMPLGTVHALVSQKRIPHLRFGRRFVRFSAAELRAWIRSQAVPVFKAAVRHANAHRL